MFKPRILAPYAPSSLILNIGVNVSAITFQHLGIMQDAYCTSWPRGYFYHSRGSHRGFKLMPIGNSDWLTNHIYKLRPTQ